MFGEFFAIAALMSYGAMLFKVLEERKQKAKQASAFKDMVDAASVPPKTEKVLPFSGGGLVDLMKNQKSSHTDEEES